MTATPTPSTRPSGLTRLIGSLGMVLALAACGDKTPAPAAAAPAQVTAMTVAVRDVPLAEAYMGQIAGSREIEIRARVGGIIKKRMYVEGKPVQANAPLFQIDPAPFRAALDQAKGALALQTANLTKTKQDYDRVLPLFAENAVSQKDRDDARASFESAQASVQSAQAKVREAQINLDYTLVTAPISGLTSKEEHSEGSLVTTSPDGSLLTKIAQIDPVYVNFAISDSEVLKQQAAQKAGRYRPPAEGKFEAELTLADGTRYPVVGRLNFTDNIIDTSTGTLRARATFANPNGTLLPGQFVRVQIRGATLANTLLIPQRAILTTQAGKIVFVIGEGNKATARPIETGESIDQDIVVEKGLKAGERIVVEGAIKVRPGAVVNITAPAAAAPAQPQPAK